MTRNLRRKSIEQRGDVFEVVGERDGCLERVFGGHYPWTSQLIHELISRLQDLRVS